MLGIQSVAILKIEDVISFVVNHALTAIERI